MMTRLSNKVPAGAAFEVDDCASRTRRSKATVLPKNTMRQRVSALRLFSIALFSCHASPGLQERLGNGAEVQIPGYARKIFCNIPQPDDQKTLSAVINYNAC